MKKMKIFFNGERLRDVYAHATKWQVFKFKVRKFIRNIIRISLAGGMVYGVFVLGGLLNPIMTYATQEKIVHIEIESDVMKRIAQCESGGTHTKDGQVIFNANSNGSVDIGIYQINSVWRKKATELGFDLTKESDNKAMAMWIYKNRGTEDWYSSKKCWMK